MAGQSGVASRNRQDLVVGAISVAVMACLFVPLGMEAKGQDLAGLCAGSFMHGLPLTLGWALTIGVALAIFIGSALTSIVRHKSNVFLVGAVVSLAAPMAFAIGIAIASTGECPPPPRLTEPPSAPAAVALSRPLAGALSRP
jgi:hypothetical protein